MSNEQHTANIIARVHRTLTEGGRSPEAADNVINELLSAGIFFRERVELPEIRKYEKKPVTIHAVQFMGGVEAATPIINWILENGGTAVWRDEYAAWHNEDGTEGHSGSEEGLYIKTLEGDMHVSPKDYVIWGVKGEFYPCKPDIFQELHREPSSESPFDVGIRIHRKVQEGVSNVS